MEIKYIIEYYIIIGIITEIILKILDKWSKIGGEI